MSVFTPVVGWQGVSFLRQEIRSEARQCSFLHSIKAAKLWATTLQCSKAAKRPNSRTSLQGSTVGFSAGWQHVVLQNSSTLQGVVDKHGQRFFSPKCRQQQGGEAVIFPDGQPCSNSKASSSLGSKQQSDGRTASETPWLHELIRQQQLGWISSPVSGAPANSLVAASNGARLHRGRTQIAACVRL